MALVDLHVHSTASDGTMTPAGLFALAGERALGAIAISDHDTLDGIPEASEAARRASGGGPVFVPGVELSVDLVSGSSAHLLGYFPVADIGALCDAGSPLGRALARVRQARNRRNPAILEKLRALGFELEEEEVASLAAGDVVGRPHIAQALLNHGFVESIREAFDRFLARGRPAYVERERLGEAEALGLICGAGGLPVLAHPGLLGRDRDALPPLIRSMRERGLRGVEAYYPRHSAELSTFLVACCRAEGLVVTGGTDFHGLRDDPSRLGGTPGSFEVTEEQVDSFLDLCRSSHGG